MSTCFTRQMPPITVSTTAPDLPSDLWVQILSWAMLRHWSLSGNPHTHNRVSDNSLPYQAVRTVLTVMHSPSYLMRVALRVLGVPRPRPWAASGNVSGLQMLAKFKYLDPTNDTGYVFWTAVAYNQLDVMDWWSRTMGWPVAKQVFVCPEMDDNQLDDPEAPCDDFAACNAVQMRSWDAIAWLLDHPEIVASACVPKPHENPACFAGAISDSSLGTLLTSGHEALALRWIRAKYAMVRMVQCHFSPTCWSRPAYQLDKQVDWTSQLMRAVSEHGAVHMLDAMQACTHLYAPLLRDDAWSMVKHAVVNAQLDMLAWWLDPKCPWIAGYFDLVGWVSESEQPLVVLDWFRPLLVGLQSDPVALHPLVCDNAHGPRVCDVLTWLRNAQVPISYTSNAMDCASQQGNIDILDWWKSSGLPLKYTEQAMDKAPSVVVLEWWLHSGLELKYTASAMDHPSNTQILNWWKTQAENGRVALKCHDDL